MLLIHEYSRCSWIRLLILATVRAGTMFWRKPSFSKFAVHGAMISPLP